MTEFDRLHRQTDFSLRAISMQSSMSTEDFCRAILTLARNEAVLRAALNRSTLTTGEPDLTKPEKPIEP